MRKSTILLVMAVLMGVFGVAGSCAAQRFVKSPDGQTVTDTRTKLMWAVRDNGSEIAWTPGKEYCLGYTGGGYTDWRMPARVELVELCNAGGRSVINITAYVWSFDTEGYQGWFVNFDNCLWGLYPWSSGSNLRVLPVRKAQ